MKATSAISALGALAHETRLAIFRYLVTAGPKGAAAGEIAERLGLPNATLSFHLKELKTAELVTCDRDGRSRIYAADFSTMNALLGYLTENCCRDDPDACNPSNKGCPI